VSETRDGDLVLFKPKGTTYELHLVHVRGPYGGPINSPVEAVVRLKARKVYTVPSGGNFVTPIFGPPRIVQGRVKLAQERTLVVQAGTNVNVVVELPSADAAIDLNNGPIVVGAMVNVAALSGATFELC
jgi:hypothetical protein